MHHYYRLEPGGKHIESSFVGHLFVLFDELLEPPETIMQLPAEHFVCGFSAATASPGCEAHQLVVHSDRRAEAWAGPRPDCEYRVMVRHPDCLSSPALVPLTDWMVKYRFVVPEHPSSTGCFDATNETVYCWADLSFDAYGPSGEFPIHRYRMNQIVPQVMTGNCLDQSTESFEPQWHVHSEHWVMQAQYYWQGVSGESFALCGSVERVYPGDLITTTVNYTASDGAIRVSIRAAHGPQQSATQKRSEITIDRPFPNNSAMFDSWSDFFKAAVRLSGEAGARGRPCFNIEYKGLVSLPTLRHMCPLQVIEACHPGVLDSEERWPIEFFCARQGTTHELRSLDGTCSLHIRDCVVGCGEPLKRK